MAEGWSSMNRHAFVARIIVTWAGMLVAACASTDAERQAAERPQLPPASIDSFRIVDCVLPSEVRKLGRQAEYFGPKRTIKTSFHDCQIRGGECILYERADYATALHYWLPQANEGDPLAQTYVGEIFEKGPAGQPDYAAAAEWHRRAAERGNARAAINLGALYERGLGVPKDPKQAAAWYRRAAGLPGVAFDVEASQAAEQLRQLQAQNAEMQKALTARQAEADALRRRLAEARANQASERERRELQDKLARTDADLAAARAAHQRAVNELRAATEAKEAERRTKPPDNGGRPLPVVPPPRGVSYGTYPALVIAIGEYRNLAPVDTAVQDAQEVARILRDAYGFKVRLQSNPRGDEVKSELVALRERLRTDDNLLIYFAGRCELGP